MLALVRLVLGPGAKITCYPSFLLHAPYLPAAFAVGVEKALKDVVARMTEANIDDPRQALNLIAFDDFSCSKMSFANRFANPTGV